jgi:excisionase family DNA binding protein
MMIAESIRQRGDQRFQPPLLVSKRDAAALLGVCLRSIDNYIAAKELPCRRLGKRVLIPYSALVAFARRDHLPAIAETAPECGA